ncbi:hypothetical protein [Streptomyces radicis]|uniref:hypothetical protein n=1 Tax=Streptomyces radicis TaxID=1750517 RepID=UPI001600574A|nr:hypothetical protein [Streptomyces radicis]
MSWGMSAGTSWARTRAAALGGPLAPLVPLLVLCLALLLALPPMAGTAVAARPAAGTPGFCPGATGVTVVVDFQALGGGRVVRCAPGAQPDGVSALRAAGFDVAGTNRWGDSFVCRINERPGPAAEPCVDTPPADAYWSYWHAENGGAWTYSQLGATYRQPPEGSFEGWSFSTADESGGTPPPGVAPERRAEGGSGGGSGGNASGGGSGGGATGGDTGGSGDGGGEPDLPGDRPSSPPPPPELDDPSADPGSPEESRDPDDPDAPDDPGEEPTAPPGESPTAAPPPTEDPGWSGEDSAFEEERAEAERPGGPSAFTFAALAMLAVLVVAGAVVARRRRRDAGSADAG